MPDEPNPIHNNLPPVWELVIQEMQERDQVGRKRYGTPLQPFNGRDARNDLQQELLDALVYNKQAEIEWQWLLDKLHKLYADVVYGDVWSDFYVLRGLVIPVLNEIKEHLHLVDYEFEKGDGNDK